MDGNDSMFGLVLAAVVFAFVGVGCSNDDGGDDQARDTGAHADEDTNVGDIGEMHDSGDMQDAREEHDDGETHDVADGEDGGDAGGMDFAEYTSDRQTTTEHGEFFVAYTPDPDPIPVSDLFTMDVTVHESQAQEAAVAGAQLTIEAEMPTHGHAMNTNPEVTEQSDGTYLIEGMKFHMPSDPENPWVMDLTVENGETTDVAKFKVITDADE